MFEGILKSEISERKDLIHLFETHVILQVIDLWGKT